MVDVHFTIFCVPIAGHENIQSLETTALLEINDSINIFTISNGN